MSENQGGFAAPNHTQTPNALFDVMMKDMGEAELKVTLCAVRKTLGFHKTIDPISLTQFQDMTGLSRQGVIDGIDKAIQRGTIKKVGIGKRKIDIFELVMTGQDDGLVKPVDQSTALTSQDSGLVKPVDTQKKVFKEKDIAQATPIASSEKANEPFMQDASQIIDTAFERIEKPKPQKPKALPVVKNEPDVDLDFKRQVSKTFRAYGNHANGISRMLLGTAREGEYAKNNITPAASIEELKAFYDYRVSKRGGAQYIPQRTIFVQSSFLEWRDTPDYTHWQRRMEQQKRMIEMAKSVPVASPQGASSTPVAPLQDNSDAVRARMYQDPFGGN